MVSWAYRVDVAKIIARVSDWIVILFMIFDILNDID
jgi:hypothetical protein